MGSFDFGKPEVVRWIREHFPPTSEVLDVGACDGKWRNLLPEFTRMDAVEAYKPNAENLGAYRRVFNADIRAFKYARYDLIIFGDVLEHMPVEDAQEVLAFAMPRCRDLVVAVPWLYKQGAEYGNPYEEHVQDDLTPEIFAQRYPDLEVLHDPGFQYCYYHKKGGDNSMFIAHGEVINIEPNIYDEEEIHKNCTVQILRNSVTGDVSIGWWENEPEGVEP